RLGRRLRLLAARDGAGGLAAAAARLSRGHAGRAAAVPRCRAADPGCGAGASRAVVTAVASVVQSVFRNPELRRVQVAFVAFNAAEWGVWIAMLVYAYERGGATKAGIVAVVQLVPATVFAPFAAGLGDRFPPARVLTLAYVLQAAALGATGASLLAGAPTPLSYALAAVATTAVTLTRPTQAALVPALARAPEDLTAANVVSGWIESMSLVAAPALAGVLLSVGSAGLVFAVMAGLSLVGGLVVLPVSGPPAAAVAAPPLQAFRLVREEPEARLLLGLLAAESVAIGALDVVYVVLAISLLDLGGSDAGYLNAAFGAGGGARLVAIDRRATVPVVELSLLRSLPLFAPLGPPQLESLARELEPVRAAAGEPVVREGEGGDRFYVVADGELGVSAEGRPLRSLRRRDSFGEIALLHDVPRTATVTATTEARLYALARAPFLAAVTAHPDVTEAAERIVGERLAAEPATIAR